MNIVPVIHILQHALSLNSPDNHARDHAVTFGPNIAQDIPDGHLPDFFDPRDKWNCPSLDEIRDQGECGGCWAFGPAAVMTDRVCIQSGGTKHFHFSAEDILACTSKKQGCQGGSPQKVWKKWHTRGYVSGGNYGSNEGCKPYSLPPCSNHMKNCLTSRPTPKCQESCRSGYSKTYSYSDGKKRGKPYYTITGEKEVMEELYSKGPVTVGMDLYSDFANYTSGVYEHTSGHRLGGHVVKLMGWGVENGKKYWLVANSWGTDFGEKGFFKIRRGTDECGIETLAIVADPILEDYI